MLDQTPQGFVAAFLPPGAWFSDKGLGSSLVLLQGFPIGASIAAYLLFVVPTELDSSAVPCPGSPSRASIAVYPSRAVPTAGTAGASRVLRPFSSPMPRPEDSGGPSTPSPSRVSRVLPSVYVKTLGVRTKLISKLYPHFRARAAPTAYGLLCLRVARLVRRPQATPPRTQDSIRVGGSPLPGRDLHPARNAELGSGR